MRRLAVALLFFAALIALWELAARSGRWSIVLLPSPVFVAEYIWARFLTVRSRNRPG